MTHVTSINSLIDLSLPSVTPEAFENPEVRAALEIFITTQTNLLHALEQYLGVTQKDTSLWSILKASDTLLAHQLNRFYAIAGENLAQNDIINIYNDSGTAKARKANATSGSVRPARGFCSTTGGVTSGNRGEFILSQGIIAVSGVVAGDIVYLSTTAGTLTLTAPTGAGQLEQFFGFGVATDLVLMNLSGGPYVQH